MPSLSFVLPHWLYWSVLALFPLVAIVSRCAAAAQPARSAGRAVHRLPLLVAGRFPRAFTVSTCAARWGFVVHPGVPGHPLLQRPDPRRARRRVADLRGAPGGASRRRTRAARADDGSPEAASAFAKAQAEARTREAEYQVAKAVRDHWKSARRLGSHRAGADAARRRRPVARHGAPAPRPRGSPTRPWKWYTRSRLSYHEGGVGEDPTLNVHTPVHRRHRAGQYGGRRIRRVLGPDRGLRATTTKCMARFVFNSPTNWVHESMFLMFGMQYILCGAYAYKEDQHVASTCSMPSSRRGARRWPTSSRRYSSSSSR